MEIRRSAASDLEEMAAIYERARSFMESAGNGKQWTDGYPDAGLLKSDIERGNSYVCIDDGKIACTFYLGREIEPTYQVIADGAWLNEEPYGVIHRIASSGSARGAASYCIKWCLEQCGNIRIDTHAQNIPMQKVLERLGFSYCGIVYMGNGDERIAFQKAGS